MALVAVAVVAVGLLAQVAIGAEQTRESYIAQVEPICKVNTKANERILKGVRAEVRAGKLKLAAAQFSKAGTALKKALAQLRDVPQPTADKAKLTKWLDYIKTEVQLLERVAAKLKAGNKFGAQTTAIRLTQIANLANAEVVDFEFRYCRANPSLFT